MLLVDATAGGNRKIRRALDLISLYVLYIILRSFQRPIRAIIQVCVLLSPRCTIHSFTHTETVR